MREFLTRVEGLIGYYKPFVEQKLQVSLGSVEVLPIDELFPDNPAAGPIYVSRPGIIYANDHYPLVRNLLAILADPEYDARKPRLLQMHKSIMHELAHQVHFVLNPHFAETHKQFEVQNLEVDSLSEQDKIDLIVAEGFASYLAISDWSPLTGLYIVGDLRSLYEQAGHLLQVADEQDDKFNAAFPARYAVGYRFFAEALTQRRFMSGYKNWDTVNKKWLEAILHVAKTNDVKPEEIRTPKLYVERMGLPRRIWRYRDEGKKSFEKAYPELKYSF